MGELDTCLDAFKHLPYFKPLYTTILRQLLQYLTEQLSRHASEESLVLISNISTGTISSLTSTFGTGFLDHRTDIKKEFTIHCAQNKKSYESYEKSFNKRDGRHLDNKEQKRQAPKRKKTNVQQNSDAFLDVPSQPKDHDKCVNPVAGNKAVPEEVKVPDEVTHEGVDNIEIENVRSLQKEKDSAKGCDKDKEKFPDKPAIGEEFKESITVVIKQEDDAEDDCFVITQTEEEHVSNESSASDKDQDSTSFVPEQDTKNVQEMSIDEINVAETEMGISDDNVKDYPVADDIISVRKSYLSSSEEGSLSEKLVTESDGNDMWILAGVNSEMNIMEMSHPEANEKNLINMQPSEISEGAESFNYAMNKNITHSPASRPSSYTNIEQDFEIREQFTTTGNLSTSHNSCSQPDEKQARYKCHYCSQRFTTSSSQKRHERRHTGEKPWSCEFCGQKFYRKDDLHVHSLKHSGQKPYMCPICLTGYCKKKLLDLHVAAHAESGLVLPLSSV